MQISLVVTLSQPLISQSRKKYIIPQGTGLGGSHSCILWKFCFITPLDITHFDFLVKKKTNNQPAYVYIPKITPH